MISKAIYEDCKRRNKNLSIVQSGFQKAFHSVPHSCVETSIELVGVKSKIVRFCQLSVEKLSTRFHLKTNQEEMQSLTIQIRRRIFQRDSLSPSLLCVAFIPLTNQLNRADYGYQVHGTERKINHLLYTGDLKLLGRKEDDLENEIKIVKAISKDINMNFGLGKCARTRLTLRQSGEKYSRHYSGGV